MLQTPFQSEGVPKASTQWRSISFPSPGTGLHVTLRRFHHSLCGSLFTIYWKRLPAVVTLNSNIYLTLTIYICICVIYVTYVLYVLCNKKKTHCFFFRFLTLFLWDIPKQFQSTFRAVIWHTVLIRNCNSNTVLLRRSFPGLKGKNYHCNFLTWLFSHKTATPTALQHYQWLQWLIWQDNVFIKSSPFLFCQGSNVWLHAIAHIANIPNECDICDKELSNHLVSQN